MRLIDIVTGELRIVHSDGGIGTGHGLVMVDAGGYPVTYVLDRSADDLDASILGRIEGAPSQDRRAYIGGQLDGGDELKPFTTESLAIRRIIASEYQIVSGTR